MGGDGCLVNALILFAALTMVDVPVTDEGASFCVTVTPDVPGLYYFRATATNSEAETSAFSPDPTLRKQLPGDICWQNPSQNVNETTLVDLVSIRVYYDTEPINVLPAVPSAPATTITMTADCAQTCQSATVIQGETGTEITIDWNTSDGPFEVRVLKWPDGTVPVAVGTMQGNTFSWAPTKAGVYYVTLEGQTLSSGVMTHLFFVKLAAPSGGGLG